MKLALSVAGFIAHWTLRTLWIALAQLVLVLMLLLVWLTISEQAPRWVWSQVDEHIPELTISDINGRLLTGLSLGTLRWQSDDIIVELTDSKLKWLPANLLQGNIDIEQLFVSQLQITQLTKSEEPPTDLVLPEISLPFPWFLRDVRINELSWKGLDAEPLIIQELRLKASGSGHEIALAGLGFNVMGADILLLGDLQLKQHYPLNAQLLLSSAQLPWQQRIDLTGNLSALVVNILGPEQWPITMAATLNVLPVIPQFDLRLSWPAWQIEGQPDWRILPGELTAKGDTQQGSGALNFALNLAPDAELAWPEGWPRSANLAGPINWQLKPQGVEATVDWNGRFGAMPWVVNAFFDQAEQAKARLDMRLADSRLALRGAPESGISLLLNVPNLQRFQSLYKGRVNIDGRWQGGLDGQGRINAQVNDLRDQQQVLLRELKLGFKGSVAKHTLDVRLLRDDVRLNSLFQGGLDLADEPVWQGVLRQATVNAEAAGEWQLAKPAELMLSAQQQRLARQCWLQSPWQLCLDADLNPQQWLANIDAQGKDLGAASMQLRRDPTLADPPLDVSINLKSLDLAKLPVTAPAGMRYSGILTGQVDVSGSLEAPLANGQLRLSKGSLVYPEYALDWRPLTLVINFLGDKVELLGNIADQQKGLLEITGETSLQADWQASIKIKGQDLGLGFKRVARVRLSPDISIEANSASVRVRGQIAVPYGRFTLADFEAAAAQPSSDVVVVVDQQGNNLRLEKAPLDAVAIEMYVTVVLGNDVRISGMGLNTDLQGKLEISQRPETFLAANGELRFGDSAIFEAYGQRLQIRTGRFLFAGPMARPNINIEAVRVVDDVTVGLRVFGMPPTPAAELFSDQAMSQEEMLSYLVLGRSLSNAGTPTAAEQQAMALGAALKLSGRTGVLERFGSRLGISDFTLATEGDSDQTQVAVSGYLRPNLQLSFGVGLFDQSQLVRIRYRINPKLSLEAISSLESAITLFYTFRR